ncbi:hypothetical protein M0R45_016118 [Rubus argutus]|uniref:Uncharacterized protein n=1 Tax=Rubus argutus TaxID=59490 RepID=A0AAW1XVA0_RUBAR
MERCRRGEGNKMGSGSDEMGRTRDRGYGRGEGRDQGDTGYEASTGRIDERQHNLGFWAHGGVVAARKRRRRAEDGGLGMKKRESAHGGRAGIEPVMIDSERTPPSREYGETPRAAARAWEAGGDWGHTQQRPQDSAVLGVSIVAELD